MTTLVDLTNASVLMRSTSSLTFSANATALLRSRTSMVAGAAAVVGGVLQQDGQMLARSTTSTSFTASVKQAAAALLRSTSSMAVRAALSGPNLLQPLAGLSGDAAYGMASGALHPLIGSSGDLPDEVGQYAYGSSMFAPLVGQSWGFSGTIGGANVSLQPLASLTGDYPYGGGTSTLEPLEGVSFGYDPDTPPYIDAYMISGFLVGDEWTLEGTLHADANSTMEFVSTMDPERLVPADMDSAVLFAADLESASIYYLTIADVVNFLGQIDTGELSSAWVMNMNNNATSRYTGFQFDSAVLFNGRFIAAGPAGLSELTGDTDDGTLIVASVLLGKTDFDSVYRKRLDQLYLGLETEGELHVTIRTDDGRGRTYRALPTNTLRTSYVKAGKGMLSRYFQVELTNPDGDDFTVESAELVPTESKRRRT